ncbi:hypothetical protein Pcinc_012733 [Petrolisthes cinctipes]|uniref:Uncharacterized protein n=1 Tax=Petrolisthes cinctipes TaxID=88211 RepID=A0AAE1G0L7_PETCI|nr:hypothetical protein Pcinc_012733 [Petrolisthes cinctipes]
MTQPMREAVRGTNGTTRKALLLVEFKCTKYAPGSQVCEGAAFTSHAHTLQPAAHTSLLVALLALLHSVRHLLA